MLHVMNLDLAKFIGAHYSGTEFLVEIIQYLPCGHLKPWWQEERAVSHTVTQSTGNYTTTKPPAKLKLSGHLRKMYCRPMQLTSHGYLENWACND